MNLCEWYNEDTIRIQNYISNPLEFYKVKTPTKYKNILSSVKKSDNNFKLNFLDDFNNNKVDNIICSHKYQINFSNKQHQILIEYFKECSMIYNLCVDIWKELPNVTTNWQLLKDIIYKHIYRNRVDNFNISIAKTLIINDLKKKQEEFNIFNLANQKQINEIKQKVKEKYNNDMIEYKNKVSKNKKAIIKEEVIKPKMEKIKINKLKNPPKQRGEKISKPAPDETLKAEIRDFCKNLAAAKDRAFKNGKYNKNTQKFESAKYEMKYKNTIVSQTISISDRNISNDGIFIKTLGKLECNNFKKITTKYKLNKECKLQYDFTLNKYYLFVIFDGKDENLINESKIKKQEIVAIDQGEKIFNYFYSNNTIGKLGDNMRIKILGWQKEIKKYQSILDKNNNKNGKKINNKKN